jgi:hypothetical protein
MGAAAFAALGLAVTALVPNSDAAPAIFNFSIHVEAPNEAILAHTSVISLDPVKSDRPHRLFWACPRLTDTNGAVRTTLEENYLTRRSVSTTPTSTTYAPT